jgi:hypothetical protein
VGALAVVTTIAIVAIDCAAQAKNTGPAYAIPEGEKYGGPGSTLRVERRDRLVNDSANRRWKRPRTALREPRMRLCGFWTSSGKLWL